VQGQCGGGLGSADCGNDPENGDTCSGGTGMCEGSQNCYCVDGEVFCG